jgi:hypothetical protein
MEFNERIWGELDQTMHAEGVGVGRRGIEGPQRGAYHVRSQNGSLEWAKMPQRGARRAYNFGLHGSSPQFLVLAFIAGALRGGDCVQREGGEVRPAFIVGAGEGDGVILPDPAPNDAPATITSEAELGQLNGRWTAPVLYGGLG